MRVGSASQLQRNFLMAKHNRQQSGADSNLVALEPDVKFAGKKSLGHPGGVDQRPSQVQHPHQDHVVERGHVHGSLKKSRI